jgi:cob(I)alamin adenosyltransferase
MVKLNKIYTKTGDDGTTGLVSADRVSKTHPRIEAIGTVDELNAALGLALSHLNDKAAAADLGRIQNDLFDLGADLATPEEMDGALRIVATQTEWLEAAIDRLNEDLPPLTSFILPAGSSAASALHLARAIARRAERDIWRLAESEKASPEVTRYLNRLSDYLFVLARKIARDTDTEVLWQPGENR